MNRNFSLKSLVAGAIVGSATMLLLAAATNTPWNGQKWEYRYVENENMMRVSSELLNAAGQEGWEAVDVPNGIIVLMKRPAK